MSTPKANAPLVSKEDPHQLVAHLGAVRVLAYIIAVRGPGFTWDITTAELWVAEVLGVKRTELDRRKRELSDPVRGHGWGISCHRGVFTLDHIGAYIWHPGFRKSEGYASASLKTRLTERDERKCMRCGKDRDPRTGEAVKLTVGRILPGALGGAYTTGNCQLECQCNYAVRDSSFPRINTVQVPTDPFPYANEYSRLRALAMNPPKADDYGIFRNGRQIA